MSESVSIPLNGRVGAGLSAIIDAADADLVRRYSWHGHKARGSRTIYARATVGRGSLYLHRLITGAGKGDEVDHIDGDGLNNRRLNLRHLSHAENIKDAYLRRRRQAAKEAFDLYESRL